MTEAKTEQSTSRSEETLPRIEAAALHVVGGTGRGTVLADALLELTPQVKELLGRYIARGLGSDTIRIGRFREDSRVDTLTRHVMEKPSELLEGSRELAESLSTAMSSRKSSPGDLAVVCATDLETGQSLMALLKIDLSTGWRREIVRSEGETRLRLVRAADLLPDPDRRLQKAAFIPEKPHPFPYDLVVLDQQSASTERNPAGFFTNEFLACDLLDGPKEMTRRLPQETERWLLEEGAGPTMAIQAREAVVQALKQPEVDIEALAGAAFEDRGQRQRFLDHMEGTGFRQPRFSPDPNVVDRLSSTLTYVLDNGVKISGDAEAVAALLDVDSDPTDEGKVRIVIESARFERKY